jgi:hypothetical protein
MKKYPINNFFELYKLLLNKNSLSRKTMEIPLSVSKNVERN